MNNPESQSPAEDAAQNAPSDAADETAATEAPPTEGLTEGLPEVEPLTPELVEDEAIRGDFMLRWAVVLLAFLTACTEIAESRTLVHIKTGQYIASHGMLPPRHDVFSYTAADRPWINTAWLFDLLVSAVYLMTGAVGLTIFKALLAGTAFGFVVHTSRSGISTWWGSICATLSLLVCLSQFHAMPELVTLLGVAIELWLLNQWREKHEPKSLWGIAVLILVWGNLDPRMYLGLALLVLYAAGQAVGRLFGRAAASSSSEVGRLWMVTGVCVVVALINPFGWHTLTAPLSLYGVEYPALRALTGDTATVEQLGVFSLVSKIFWQSFSYHTLAGLMLAAAALVSLALNWDEVDFGDVFIFLGFAGFAMAASHELASASIVFAVVATLNAQAWYARSFRQTYSIETSELVFSRGGRAATVVALFALAYLSISGHIGGETTRRTGFGWHSSLQAAIDGTQVETAEAFDNKPFNTLLRQGDVLIWSGRQVFIDTRVALYDGSDDENIIDLHRKTRAALRSPQLSGPEIPRDRNAQRTLFNERLNEQRKFWREVFDKYGVTHVLVDITAGRSSSMAYPLLFDLASMPRDWQQAYLGAVSSAFYRKDLQNPELKAYLSDHRIDLLAEAFDPSDEPAEPVADATQNNSTEGDKDKTDDKKTDATLTTETAESDAVIRPEWARSKTFYDKYLSLPPAAKPNSIRQAEHYAFQLELAQTTGRLSPEVGTAIAHLAIRSANVGLSDNPQSAEGFLTLATAYQYLDAVESMVARSDLGTYIPQRRWYQTIAALNQALVIEPDNAAAHFQLFEFYLNRQKLDLALRELEIYDRLTADKPVTDERQRQFRDSLARRGEELKRAVDSTTDGVNRYMASNTVDRLRISQQVYQNGFVLLALQIIENDSEYLNRSLPAQLQQAILQMESGQTEQALEVLERIQGASTRLGDTGWREPKALACLGNGNYQEAISLFDDAALSIEENRMSSLLTTLPMIAAPDLGAGRPAEILWPQIQFRAATVGLLQLPDQAAQNHFDAALCYLETGKPKEAAKELHKVLAVAPETGLRPLVAFYLAQTNKEYFDPRPYLERIPVEADLFVDGPGDAYSKPAAQEKPTADGKPTAEPKPADKETDSKKVGAPLKEEVPAK